MNFIPCAHLHRVADEDQFRKMLVAAKIWGSPCVFIYADITWIDYKIGIQPPDSFKTVRIAFDDRNPGCSFVLGRQQVKYTNRPRAKYDPCSPP